MKARAWRALAQIDRPQFRPGDRSLQRSAGGPQAHARNPGRHAAGRQPGRPGRRVRRRRDCLPPRPGQGPQIRPRQRRPGPPADRAQTVSRGRNPASRGPRPNPPTTPPSPRNWPPCSPLRTRPRPCPFSKSSTTPTPDDAITRMLAEVLAEAGDAAGSDQLVYRAAQASPNDPDLLVAHGQNLIRQLKYLRPSPPSTRRPSSTRPTPTAGAAWPLPPREPISLPSRCTRLPCGQSIFPKSRRPTSFGQPHTIRFTKSRRRQLLPSLSGFLRRQVPRSGMAGSPTSPNCSKKNREMAIL
jgi:hypothetical protein